jgi:hypothetical protein
VLIEAEGEPAPADRPGHIRPVAGVTRVLVGLVALERLGLWRVALAQEGGEENEPLIWRNSLSQFSAVASTKCPVVK